MRLVGQQFRRTLPDPLPPFAPQEAAVIEEELKQFQIVRSQMAAKEEVAAQSAVEILDDRTGADGQSGQFAQRLAEREKAVAELATQHDLARPTGPIRCGQSGSRDRSSATMKSNISQRVAWSGPANASTSSCNQPTNRATSVAKATAWASALFAAFRLRPRAWVRPLRRRVRAIFRSRSPCVPMAP